MKPVFIALLCSITLPAWAGADQTDPLAVDVLDDLGWNALDYATKNRQPANADYLRSVGATPARREE